MLLHTHVHTHTIKPMHTRVVFQEHARELQAFKDAHGEGYMELRRTAKALKTELEREQQRRAELVEDVGGVRG